MAGWLWTTGCSVADPWTVARDDFPLSVCMCTGPIWQVVSTSTLPWKVRFMKDRPLHRISVPGPWSQGFAGEKEPREGRTDSSPSVGPNYDPKETAHFREVRNWHLKHQRILGTHRTLPDHPLALQAESAHCTDAVLAQKGHVSYSCPSS